MTDPMSKQLADPWPWPKQSPRPLREYIEFLANEDREIRFLLDLGGMSDNVRETLAERLKRNAETRAVAETFYEQN